MSIRALALCLALVLVLPAADAARPQPSIYFFKDTDNGPLVDGTLDWMPPPPADLVNPANNTPPSVRMVGPVVPVQFLTPNADNNTAFLYGPIIVGLWAPDAQTIREGTLVVEFLSYPADTGPVLGEGTLIASQSVPIVAGNVTPPDPQTWVPPDPTDPEAAIAHVAGKAAAYALPMLLQAPYLVVLTAGEGAPIQMELPADARVGIRLSLAPAEGSPLPIPTGVGQPIEYDFGLSPSFVYVPWYNTTASPTKSPTSTPTSSGARPTTGAPTLGPGSPTPDEGQDSPLGPIAVLLALIAVAAWAARRRL